MAQFPEVGVKLVADDAGKYIADIGRAEDATSGLGRSIEGAAGMMGSFGQSLSRVGGLLTGGIALGVGALGAAFSGAAITGFQFNNSMEQVEAQLFAFLKDGQAVADTLDMIKDRAAQTPFEFENMATAVTSLIPAAKQAGQPIEELIELAEILAASNPSEGLEGAAFSLREAMSGDFVSIVERFNLPRQRLNELKAEGVPALEAIRIAMSELGLDADLVINLSQTLSGRWSTIKDVFTGLAATMTKPIFDAVSDGAGRLISQLDILQPSFDQLGLGVANFIEGIMAGQAPLDIINIAIKDFGRAFGLSTPEIRALREQFTEFYTAVSASIAELVAIAEPYLAQIGEFITNNVELSDVMTALGIAIGAFVLPVIGSLIVSLGTLLAPILLVIGAVALARTAWENNWGGIQEKTAVVFAFLSENIPVWMAAIQEVIASVLAAITAFWDTYGAQIVSIASLAWDTIMSIVQLVMGIIMGIVSGFVETAQQRWATFGDQIIAITTFLWEGILGIIEGALKVINGIINTFIGLFTGDWELMAESLWQIVEGMWQVISSNFSAAALALIGIVAVLVENFVRRFTDEDWGTLGGNIVRGIADGISGGAQWIVDAATSAATSALDAAKAALGIQSPSKAFEAIGKATAEGMANGIAAMAKGVEDEVEKTTDAITEMWESAGININKLVLTAFQILQTNITVSMLIIRLEIEKRLQEIQQIFAEVTENIGLTWQQWLDRLLAAVNVTMPLIVTAIASSLENISNTFDIFFASTFSNWQAFWASLESVAVSSLSSVRNSISNELGSIRQLFIDLVGQIENIFTSANWQAVGAAITQGIIDGIDAGAIAAAAAAAAAGAVSAGVGAAGGGAPPPVPDVPPMAGDRTGGIGSGLPDTGAAFLSPVPTAAQINNITYAKNMTLTFNANYASQPEITDEATLARAIAGYA